MKRVYEFLKNCETYYLATVSLDNKAKVRPFGTINIYNDKLYIQTGKSKVCYKEIMANPNVEICGMYKGEWIRVSGILVNDDSVEAKKAMLDNYPSLRSMYDENDSNTAVLYFKEATATIYSFTNAPVIIKF